jgi:tRNA-binding EMAP/Myf-like protein
MTTAIHVHASGANDQGQSLVSYATLLALDLRVGQICVVTRDLRASRQMYRLVIDLGPTIGRRYIASVITGLGPDEPGVVEPQLLGQRVIVGCQVIPKQILGEVSEGVLLSGYRDLQHGQESFPILVSEQAPVGSPVR